MVNSIDNQARRQRWVKFFTHLIVVLIIFFLPELIFDYTWPNAPKERLISVYSKALIFVGVFYLDYYVIIRCTLLARKRRWLWFVLANLALVIAALLLINTINHLVTHYAGWHGPRHQEQPFEFSRSTLMLRFGAFVLRDAGMLALTIALSVAMRLGESWSQIQERHQRMLASQREEELQSLKSQLNPHFLFNTLNTIYALIEVSPKEAQTAVHELSTLLRYVLYENPEKVRLDQEIKFARSYISLMEMRLGQGRVQASFDDQSDGNAMVAPLLFVTLIENAFKHGNTGSRDCPIKISIIAHADGTIICETENRFAPQAPDQERQGIGLTNLRRRLQLIYGENATLSTRVNGDIYTATLTIKNPY